MKNIVILGATGSIGKQAIEVINASEDLRLIGASCRTNIGELKKLIIDHKLKVVGVKGETEKEDLRKLLDEEGVKGVEILIGEEALDTLASLKGANIILNALVGLSGLKPTLCAIETGIDVALANKETLVGGGALVMKRAMEKKVKILPVDSEHSAIFQSIQGYRLEDIKSVILTASGGPFLGKTRDDLKNVTLEEALKHPNWSMGQKVTIDSASLMNKGLEAIEAHWLFNIPPKDIKVHIHPQSILHSAVEFKDNSVIGQMGVASMKLPIQYALNYPKRDKAITDSLDLFKVGRLDFLKPDFATFGCLSLAFKAMEKGGYYPLILNTADEVAVDLFIKGEIKFLEIEAMVEFALHKFGDKKKELNLSGILELDREIRESLYEEYKKATRN